MDIAEIRRRNLRSWIDNDPHSLGNVEAWCLHYSNFADRPITPSYIRQLVPERGKATRNIGEKAARRLEAAGGKPTGWLDLSALDHDDRDADHARHLKPRPLLLSANSRKAGGAAESLPDTADRWPLPEADWQRFAALPPEGRGWALAKFAAGLDEAETRYLGHANSA